MMARHSTLPFVAASIALALSGAATIGHAQASGSMPMSHDSMSAMKGKSGMMAGPHAALAMGYRDNLMTFTRALRSQSMKSTTVDLDFARPAVAEMRRSLDAMKQHHSAEMDAMGASAASPMKGATDPMSSHLESVTDHVTALESQLSASTPDSKMVADHASAILKECDGMSSMAGKMKAHTMK